MKYISDVTDVSLLNKMLHAAQSHYNRVASPTYTAADGYDVPNPEYDKKKAADLDCDVDLVQQQLKRLEGDNSDV